MGTCGVCFEDCDRSIACGRSHSICAQCAPREVERVLQALQEPAPLGAFRARGGLIKCVQDGCPGTYADSDLMLHLPARTAQRYRREQDGVARYRRATTQAQVEGRQHAAAATAEYVRMHYRNAVQCPRCGAGPVIPERCSDLQAHHGEAAANGGQINNSCPGCRFFSRDRADWHPWDGHMRGDGGRDRIISGLQLVLPIFSAVRTAFSGVWSAVLIVCTGCATAARHISASAANFTSSGSMHGLGIEHRDRLRALMDVADIDAARARRLLEENSWQLEASANSHFDRASSMEERSRQRSRWHACAVACICFGMILLSRPIATTNYAIFIALKERIAMMFAAAPSGSLAYDVPAASPFVVGAPIRLERRPGLIFGKPTTHFAARNLPEGLNIDERTGVISGIALAAINCRVEVFAFTPGAIALQGPDTGFELIVTEPMTLGSVIVGTPKAMLAGVGTIAVGSLYWLVTQND